MEDLTALVEQWENSALELREAETLINLLIVDNRRLEEIKHAVNGVFDDLFEGTLKVRIKGNETDWVDADEWLNDRLPNHQHN